MEGGGVRIIVKWLGITLLSFMAIFCVYAVYDWKWWNSREAGHRGSDPTRKQFYYKYISDFELSKSLSLQYKLTTPHSIIFTKEDHMVVCTQKIKIEHVFCEGLESQLKYIEERDRTFKKYQEQFILVRWFEEKGLLAK
jgi:hypothetical protein